MRGFTLIETIVAVAIFVLALGGVTYSVIVLYRSQSYNWLQASAINEARRGVEMIVKELREARESDNGAYAIEKASGNEIIFYSDIDRDSQVERVRYFLGEINESNQVQSCYTTIRGGSCSVSFDNLFSGELISVTLKVSSEGDLGLGSERVAIFANSNNLGNVCQSGCVDCPGVWQGDKTYDVTELVRVDNYLLLVADATIQVDPVCDWQEPGHAMKTRFELSLSEENPGTTLMKSVIKPVGNPPEYPLGTEELSVVTPYVVNTLPLFEYYDTSGNKITDSSAKLANTRLMNVLLLIDVNTSRDPGPYELESGVRLRNL